MPTLLLLIPDLFFGVKVADATRALGATAREARDPAALLALAAEGADGIVLDTKAAGDWQAAVRELKADPHTARIPILAFAPHVDVAATRAAVAAGCDRLVTRGKLSAELPTLLRELLANSIDPHTA